MKKRKTVLDERQELKLLHIEHYGCWLAYWGLIAVIFIQNTLDQGNLKHLFGELIVLCILSLYLCVSCIKNGIWERKSKPSAKTNVMISTIAAVLLGILWFFKSYYNYHKFFGSIATGIFMFLSTGFLCFATLSFFSHIYKKREEKLEKDEEE